MASSSICEMKGFEIQTRDIPNPSPPPLKGLIIIVKPANIEGLKYKSNYTY